MFHLGFEEEGSHGSKSRLNLGKKNQVEG